MKYHNPNFVNHAFTCKELYDCCAKEIEFSVPSKKGAAEKAQVSLCVKFLYAWYVKKITCFLLYLR
jgi:hypothetical protein